MLEVKDITEYLEENQLEYIDVIEQNKNFVVLRFSYKFDHVEIEAAKAYADEECKEEEDTWNFEYFLPYLNDVAVDNVNDILQDYCDDNEKDFQFIAFDVPEDNTEYNDFIAVILEKDFEIDFDDYLMGII